MPYLVGGTYAFQYYAGISRTTKDFDIFVRTRDIARTLEVFTRAGFAAEAAFTHWLAKAHHGDKFIDIIFSSGNAVAEVDDEWFAYAVDESLVPDQRGGQRAPLPVTVSARDARPRNVSLEKTSALST